MEDQPRLLDQVRSVIRVKHYVFPASIRSVDPRSGVKQRHHINENRLQRAVKSAIRKAEIYKQANCHTFGTHLRRINWNLATLSVRRKSTRMF